MIVLEGGLLMITLAITTDRTQFYSVTMHSFIAQPDLRAATLPQFT